MIIPKILDIIRNGTLYDSTFIGTVKAGSGSQAPGTYLLRNSMISETEQTPTINGQICWIVE